MVCQLNNPDKIKPIAICTVFLKLIFLNFEYKNNEVMLPVTGFFKGL